MKVKSQPILVGCFSQIRYAFGVVNFSLNQLSGFGALAMIAI